MLFTHNFFKNIMWRSSKVYVADELQIPPQEECVLWLTLSPIEEHFYQRQHETCVGDAQEVVRNLKEDVIKRKLPGNITLVLLKREQLNLRHCILYVYLLIVNCNCGLPSGLCRTHTMMIFKKKKHI